jgi:hypothetical protein
MSSALLASPSRPRPSSNRPPQVRRLLLTCALLASLALPAVAAADPEALLKDACRDERVDGTYSQADYRQALRELSTDTDEYSDCRGVLERARLAALNKRNASNGSGSGGAGGSGAGSGGSGGTPGGTAAPVPDGQRIDPLAGATAEDQSALADAKRDGGRAVTLDGARLEPGDAAGAANSLPTTLAVLLGALAAALLSTGAYVIVTRVRGRRVA